MAAISWLIRSGTAALSSGFSKETLGEICALPEVLEVSSGGVTLGATLLGVRLEGAVDTGDELTSG